MADIYQENFPNDTVIVTDAHEYLRLNHQRFDFIWSSPPCQTHSSFRQNICVKFRGTEPKYPDMKLYEEIIFLQHNSKSNWVIENVNPYYSPLIEPSIKLQRHLFWSNFEIPMKEFHSDNIRKAQIPDLQKQSGFDLSKYNVKNKRQVLRNCVLPALGLHVFNSFLLNFKLNSKLMW